MAVACSLLSSVVLARALGPDQYGLYALALSVVSMLALAVHLGLPNLVIRETGRALATEEFSLMRGIRVWAAGIMLCTGILVAGGFLAWLYIYPSLAEARRSAFLAAAPLIILLAIATVSSGVLTGLRKILWGVLPNQVVRPVLLSLAVLLWILLGRPIDAVNTMQMHTVVAALTIIIGLTAIRHYSPNLHKFRIALNKKNWQSALIPLTLVVAIQLISTNTDLILLAISVQDAEIGRYRIAVSIAQIAMFGMTVGQVVLQAHAAGLHATGQHDALQKIVKEASRLGFGLVALATLILIPFGKPLLGLVFGQQFALAATPLAIILIGKLITAYVGASEVMLAMGGEEKILLWANISSLVVKVLSCVILIPLYGVEGAAAATTLSTALAAVLTAVAVKRRLHLSTTAF
ncbi:Polysaccharide biosynthesis protein [Pigmentiphaga humi]|uniref:Polysaccharide biosynthesis protein n=1 Tax=Pigmentiphaga humi TaxID=2478468 RepID=A0A3P4B231_9BURK|nr:oligosaccharide flippase family protein [Pigmentiphaga humi]VCU70112.1 Polysaccharide biosynthesis protein [Pigmentiphaga humi]